MTLSVLGEVLAMSDPNVWVCMSTEATWIALGSDAKPIFQNRHVAHLCPLEHRAGFQLNDLMKPMHWGKSGSSCRLGRYAQHHGCYITTAKILGRVPCRVGQGRRPFTLDSWRLHIATAAREGKS